MIDRIKAKYKEAGPAGVFLAIFRRLPGVRAVCVYYVYSFQYNELKDKSVTLENVRLVVLDHKDDMETLICIQNKKEVFIERFKDNHFCVLAYVGNDPVAYLWAQQGQVHVEKRYGFEVPIKSNQIFYYDSYTTPSWRKKGLTRCLVKKMAMYCEQQLEKKEIIAIIEYQNKVSQNAYERIGFSRIRLEGFVDIFGMKKKLMLFSYRKSL